MYSTVQGHWAIIIQCYKSPVQKIIIALLKLLIEGSWIHAFPRDINPKMNVKARFDFEIVYYEDACKHVSDYARYFFLCSKANILKISTDRNDSTGRLRQNTSRILLSSSRVSIVYGLISLTRTNYFEKKLDGKAARPLSFHITIHLSETNIACIEATFY